MPAATALGCQMDRGVEGLRPTPQVAPIFSSAIDALVKPVDRIAERARVDGKPLEPDQGGDRYLLIYRQKKPKQPHQYMRNY